MLQNKIATAKLGFEICALTTIPEPANVGMGQAVRRRARNEPDPAQTSSAKGRGTGQLLMGSRVITVSM